MLFESPRCINLIKQFQGNTVHVIDFGLAKMFRSSRDETSHIPYREDMKFSGTARYSSIRTHFGVGKQQAEQVHVMRSVLQNPPDETIWRLLATFLYIF